ncbi:MAG: argininosuccinate lyase, partial [Clostridiales bacterium]|nr:argininosuccinate lyase [Clostridiales bacterium]
MKLWSGRFSKDTDQWANDFNSSISFDKRLYAYDIHGSIAHAKMLNKIGILNYDEKILIIETLSEILNSIDQGKIEFSKDAEDIHMNIETILTEKIGATGKKLHTARSRNDQVALDIRMYLRDEVSFITNLLSDLCRTLISISQKNTSTIMPGFTHMQPAQPITLAHHMMAYFEMFKRDIERLSDCSKRINIMPLGACALATTGFPIDRQFVADELNFDSITANSLDSVSDRDFAIELCSDLAIIMMHLSRFCEEIILWNTVQFAFAEQDDAFSTGSSIMPQKKNPD